ncbi:Helicase conserved C-terminal domain [Carpediemonas membranifera]|uniref:Helicase conserved C-terminal domain n=1 Tax=Carpediemonas membranifera TaxID=201153 RepID=A0A8J6B5C1_9EUKA|nr:Helicase conserved C-terminal domain [Carpediemonas membranifera]|eukprot:KAG9390357.1 Helicase conserved C-terminal domain [Carpediemonas membranifera]
MQEVDAKITAMRDLMKLRARRARSEKRKAFHNLLSEVGEHALPTDQYELLYTDNHGQKMTKKERADHERRIASHQREQLGLNKRARTDAEPPALPEYLFEKPQNEPREISEEDLEEYESTDSESDGQTAPAVLWPETARELKHPEWNARMDAVERDEHGHAVISHGRKLDSVKLGDTFQHKLREDLEKYMIPRDIDSEAEQARMKLDVVMGETNITRALDEHDVVVLTSETGSGKSTQVPQILFEAGYAANGMIGVTEPRRVAAISLARRVKAEMALCTQPDLVGHSVRFDKSLSDQTRILYATDGVVRQMALSAPLLPQFSVVVVDEAHERTVMTDTLIGFLVRAIQARKEAGMPHLKVVIMSATIQEEVFKTVFAAHGATVACVSIVPAKNPHKVVVKPPATLNNEKLNFGDSLEKLKELQARPREFSGWVADAVSSIVAKKVRDRSRGADDPTYVPKTILAFLPGQGEILEAIILTAEKLGAEGDEGAFDETMEDSDDETETPTPAGRLIRTRQARAELLPLYGTLRPGQQDRVFACPRRRGGGCEGCIRHQHRGDVSYHP